MGTFKIITLMFLMQILALKSFINKREGQISLTKHEPTSITITAIFTKVLKETNYINISVKYMNRSLPL